MAIAITGIEKQGPVIICSTNDPKNRVYKLDFEHAKIYGLSGKEIQSTNSIIGKIPYDMSINNILFMALRVFRDSCRSQRAPYYGIVESLLSYPDLLDGDIDTSLVNYIYAHCNSKLPKGYAVWCRGNEKVFSLESIKEFMNYQIFKSWPQSLADSVKRFCEGTGFDIVQATEADKELCASLMRIVNNSLKRYETKTLFNHLNHIIILVRNNPELRPYLDETKNAQTAHKILDDIVNKARNENILANEARIAALNGTTVGNLIIKVPSVMDDFVDEGEQQHNCVGYFYHDSMACGDTLIYFLRRANNPKKSYVTCRYRIDNRKTVEHRLQNNNWFDDDSIFAKIDEMIAEVLGI